MLVLLLRTHIDYCLRIAALQLAAAADRGKHGPVQQYYLGSLTFLKCAAGHYPSRTYCP